MSLFKKVEEFKKVNEESKKMDQEIRNTISKLFVNSQYETKEVEFDYDEPVGARANHIIPRNIKVYYPILNLPEGFVKEKEMFFRQYANGIVHKYTLQDEEGNKVHVECTGIFTDQIKENSKTMTEIRLKTSYIISGWMKYKITICGEEYLLSREFTPKEIMKFKEKDELKFSSDLSCYIYENATEGKEYRNYIKQLGKTQDIPSLKELSEFSVGEIKINAVISIKVITHSKSIIRDIQFEDDVIRVELKDKIVFDETTIRIIPYIISSGKELEEKKFKFYQLKEFEEGITLGAAFEMIK